MPSLAGMEMDIEAVTGAPELSPHFKADPQTCLPRLSKEFSSVLTPFICFLFLFCLPGFQLEAKTGAWGDQPITGTSPAHIRLPKRFRKAPRKVQKSPCLKCAGWSGHQKPPTPSPQEYQSPHRNAWSCWVKVWCSSHAAGT